MTRPPGKTDAPARRIAGRTPAGGAYADRPLKEAASVRSANIGRLGAGTISS